jgi:hypothetical protein
MTAADCAWSNPGAFECGRPKVMAIMHTTDDGIRNLAAYALKVARGDVAAAVRFLCDLSMPFAEACAAVEDVIALDQAQPPGCSRDSKELL